MSARRNTFVAGDHRGENNGRYIFNRAVGTSPLFTAVSAEFAKWVSTPTENAISVCDETGMIGRRIIRAETDSDSGL